MLLTVLKITCFSLFYCFYKLTQKKLTTEKKFSIKAREPSSRGEALQVAVGVISIVWVRGGSALLPIVAMGGPRP